MLNWKKKMKRMKFFWFIFALVFLAPSVFFVTTVMRAIEKADIVRYGTETTATVVDFYSDKTVNDVDYFYLKYTYEDSNGAVHNGRTSSIYTYEEAASKTTVKIRYAKDFKSIEANYVFSFQTYVYLEHEL